MVRVDRTPAGVERGELLERLYRAQGSRMWTAVLAFAGDPEVASDAVAETFAQALRRGEAIREPERWLWRTVFRIAAGELKARRREDHFLMEGSYEMEEPARELVVALAKLSEKQRGAVVLHHAAGYPVREVAAILGSTPAAVKVHLLRGRRRLRELLEEAEVDG
jgi:RNA polymerase sigma-70 factor (ECF subfamily)